MSWKREFESKCDAYELNIDPMTKKKKWTKRGLNGDLIIYSNVDNINDLKVLFELHNIQIWWKIFNPKLKKKGSKTRVVTFKRFGSNDEAKETIALRFKDSQLCQSFIAKWESLTRDIEYETTDDEEDDGKQSQADDSKPQPATNGHHSHQHHHEEVEDEKQIETLVKVADKSSFRDLIRINRLPSIELINSADILDEYYFNYGIEDKLIVKDNRINYANFSYGKYNNEEHYLSLWMNSEVFRRVFVNQYKRPRLNLVICLDISESMNESLCVNELSRLEVAQQALCRLCRHSLEKHDRFAIITYNDNVKVEWPLTLVDSLPYGMLNLRRDILNLKASGTTDLERAYETALGIYTDEVLQDAEQEGVYNRIIFLTDLQLNPERAGEYNSDRGMFGMIRNAAESKKIYTTFMSMGVEQDAALLHSLCSSVQGCNYLSVHNTQQFIAKFHKEQEFLYMLMPVLHDLRVTLDTKIYKTYTDNLYAGDVQNGELLRIQSMFGNINYSAPFILKFQYKKQLRLNIEFTDKNGKRMQSEQVIDLTYQDNEEDELSPHDNNAYAKAVRQKDFYDSMGIRKVVLLCRYTDLLRQWIKVDTKALDDVKKDDEAKPSAQHKLIISTAYQQEFAKFAQYVEKEMSIIGDQTLQRELDIVKKLSAYQDTIDID